MFWPLKRLQRGTPPGAEKRRHPRYTYPRLRLIIEGRRYKTRNWSLGGFRVDRFHRPLGKFERMTGELRVPGGSKTTFFGEVAWTNDDNDFGLRLTELDSQVFAELLEHNAP